MSAWALSRRQRPLHARVFEVGLEWPEPRPPGHHLTHDHRGIRHRSHRTGEAALVVVADNFLGNAAYDGRVALRVDTLLSDSLTDQQVEHVDQVAARVPLPWTAVADKSPPEIQFLDGRWRRRIKTSLPGRSLGEAGHTQLQGRAESRLF